MEISGTASLMSTCSQCRISFTPMNARISDEPRREVDQPVQQALDQEEQRPQAEQREGVRREDDVGLLRDAEDRGDRVEGEQQVDAADRDQHDEQRGDHPPAVDAGDQLAADVLVGDRQELARGLHDAVVLDVGVLVAVPEQLHGRVDQQQAEDQEHEREQRQQRGTERDEDRAHDQREHDPEGQDLVLVLLGHGERRHDDHEDEQVVDREALLDDVAGEVLGAELAAVSHPHPGAEGERHRDVEHGPGRGLLEADPVRPQCRQGQVEREQRDDHPDRHGPGQPADLQHCGGSLLVRCASTGGYPRPTPRYVKSI